MAAYRRTQLSADGRRAEGRWPLGAVPYSLYEPGELSKWLAMMTAP